MNKNNQNKQQMMPYTISGVIAIVLTVVIGTWLFQGIQEDYQLLTESSAPSSGDSMQDELASIGQQYISTLASHNGGEEAILFNQLDQIDGEGRRWMASFSVNQSILETELVYDYAIELLDTRVISHTVMVSDKNRSVTLSQPQPEEILESSSINVKGEVAETGLVTISLRSEEGELLSETQLLIESEEQLQFSDQIQAPSAGKYFVEIQSKLHRVLSPVIIANERPIN